FLRADFGETGDDRLRVVWSAVIAALHGVGEEARADVAIRQRRERRLLRRVLQRDDVLSGQLAIFRFVGGRGDVRFAHAGEIGLVVEDDGAGVSVGENVIAVLRGELRLFLIDRAQRRFVGIVEQRAGANEVLVVALDEILRLA